MHRGRGRPSGQAQAVPVYAQRSLEMNNYIMCSVVHQRCES